MNELHSGKLSQIKNKIKGFFKKMRNQKDYINTNPPNNPRMDSSAKYTHRDDLKMY